MNNDHRHVPPTTNDVATANLTIRGIPLVVLIRTATVGDAIGDQQTTVFDVEMANPTVGNNAVAMASPNGVVRNNNATAGAVLAQNNIPANGNHSDSGSDDDSSARDKRRDDWLAHSHKTGKTLYLPAHFIPVSRGDSKILLHHATDEIVRYWRQRYEHTMNLHDAISQQVTDADKFSCLHAQKSIRKEFRKLATKYIKERYLDAATHTFNFRRGDRQPLASFEECVEECNKLYNTEGTQEEINKNREIAWNFKYKTPTFSAPKWELVATIQIFNDYGVKIREGQRLLDGRNKSSFLKFLTVCLVKIRNTVLVPQLIRRQNQVEYIPVDEEGNMLTDQAGEYVKRKKRNGKKAKMTFNACSHVVDLATSEDGREQDDDNPAKKIKRTGASIFQTISQHYMNGGGPLDSMDAVYDLFRTTTSDDQRDDTQDDTNNDDTELLENDVLLETDVSSSGTETVTEHSVSGESDDSSDSQIPVPTEQEADSGDENVQDTQDNTNVAETQREEDTEEIERENGGSVVESVEELGRQAPDGRYIAPHCDNMCGQCVFELETDAIRYIDPQYWLHGLKCCGRDCNRVFMRGTLNRGDALIVCRNARLFSGSSDGDRLCDVVYCMDCTTLTRRRR